MSAARQRTERRIAAQEFALPGQWTGYEIPVSFPIKDAARGEELRTALWTALGRVHPPEAQVAVWLLMDNLHKDDAVHVLSRHARAWSPRMGLGVWPDQPPPRTMTGNDLLDLEWGATPRRPYHRVTQLRATPETLHDAWSKMFGVGSTILTLCPGGGQRFLEGTRAALQRPIVDESFQDFPFYFPLLGRKALATASAEELDDWLGPTQTYVRESEADQAVLVLTRSAPRLLRDALEGAHLLVSPMEEVNTARPSE